MSAEPWSAEAFDDRYRAEIDPWDFATSPYEQGRYDTILSALPGERYRAAYEPGCSVGALTTRLAERCDHLVATDVSATAVRRAQDRCRHQAWVAVEVGSVTEPPDRSFDLVVFSELGYYFDAETLDGVVAGLAALVVPGGDLVACHWLGTSSHHRLHGSTVHERLHRVLASGFRHRSHRSSPGFVVDTWRRP
jgi:SAM-dependent methyltransferase